MAELKVETGVLRFATAALHDVAVERDRQIAEEHFSSRFDDDVNTGHELAEAAASYALRAAREPGIANRLWPRHWPARRHAVGDGRRNLVKAGALILAAIEQIDRSMEKSNG